MMLTDQASCMRRVSEMLEVMQLAADQDPQQAEPADTPTDPKAIIFEQVCSSEARQTLLPSHKGSAPGILHSLLG